jgi:hypothetical protein
VKTCRKCGETKQPAEFRRNRGARWGRPWPCGLLRRLEPSAGRVDSPRGPAPASLQPDRQALRLPARVHLPAQRLGSRVPLVHPRTVPYPRSARAEGSAASRGQALPRGLADRLLRRAGVVRKGAEHAAFARERGPSLRHITPTATVPCQRQASPPRWDSCFPCAGGAGAPLLDERSHSDCQLRRAVGR